MNAPVITIGTTQPPPAQAGATLAAITPTGGSCTNDTSIILDVLAKVKSVNITYRRIDGSSNYTDDAGLQYPILPQDIVPATKDNKDDKTKATYAKRYWLVLRQLLNHSYQEVRSLPQDVPSDEDGLSVEDGKAPFLTMFDSAWNFFHGHLKNSVKYATQNNLWRFALREYHIAKQVTANGHHRIGVMQDISNFDDLKNFISSQGLADLWNQSDDGRKIVAEFLFRLHKEPTENFEDMKKTVTAFLKQSCGSTAVPFVLPCNSAVSFPNHSVYGTCKTANTAVINSLSSHEAKLTKGGKVCVRGVAYGQKKTRPHIDITVSSSEGGRATKVLRVAYEKQELMIQPLPKHEQMNNHLLKAAHSAKNVGDHLGADSLELFLQRAKIAWQGKDDSSVIFGSYTFSSSFPRISLIFVPTNLT